MVTTFLLSTILNKELLQRQRRRGKDEATSRYKPASELSIMAPPRIRVSFAYCSRVTFRDSPSQAIAVLETSTLSNAVVERK